MKQCVGRTMRMGAKGIKVQVGGRLGGAEIARSESYREVPFRCRHCVLTSTMVSQKQTPLTAKSALKSGFTLEKFSRQ